MTQQILELAELPLLARVYGEEMQREPEATVRLGKREAAPAPGKRVTLRPKGESGTPTVECEAEVVAIALIVRPDWDTLRYPRLEGDQGALPL